MKNLYKHIFALVAGIICLVVYILTLHPAVTFMDSGELAVACASFGIPHPTGYPLFLVLGYIFTLLPFSSSPVYNLNLMSAVMSAAAVILFFYASYLLIGMLKPPVPKQEQKQKKGKSAPAAFVMTENIIAWASFFSALVFGFSRTFWSNALSVEVYPLHALLMMVIIYYCLRVYISLKEHNRKYWAWLFVFTGISFANHMTTIFIVPGIIYLYYLQHMESRVFAKSVLKLVYLIIPGILLYLILIIRAASGPYLNWSDPQSIGNLLHHVTGGDYSQLMFSSSSIFSKNIKLFASAIFPEFAIFGTIIALAGFVFLYKRNKDIFYFFVILIAACLLYSLNYSIRDVQTYFLSVYIVMGFTFGAGIIYLVNVLAPKANLQKNFTLILIAAGILVSGFTLEYNYDVNNESSSYVVEDLAVNTLNQLEPNSILVTYDWGYVYPAAIYYQQVGKIRNDVKVFNIKFLSVAWYLDMIRKYYPDVYENCKEDVESYKASLNGSEQMRISKLNALVRAFIFKNYMKFPFYMTYDFIYSKEIKPMIENHLLQPNGLAYRLRNANDPYDSTAGIRSLVLKFRKYDPDTSEKEKVYISTAGVYYDNAEYHVKHKNFAMALKFIDKVLELNPSFKEALDLKYQIMKEAGRK